MNFSFDQFEKLVEKAIDELPDRYLKRMHNIAFLVKDNPTKEQIKKIKLRAGDILFGLYEGYHQSSRKNIGPVLPDTITVFRQAILSQCRNEEELIKKIKKIIIHEIAHHFGSGEQGAGKAESRRDL